MRLGFHYHVPFHPLDGRISTPGYLGRFLDSIATEVDQLTCFMHSATLSEIQYSDYILQQTNIDWINLGPKASVIKRNVFAQRYTRVLRDHLSELDGILIRGPSPLLPAMAKAAGVVPVYLLLVGDYLSGINDLPQPRWRKEAIRIWAYWNDRQQRAVAKRSLTFVNSRKLYDQLQPFVSNLVEIRTTTLNDTDFFEREDTCQKKTIRLLYAGRMDRAKGLFELVAAVDQLVQQGYDIVLDLVGWPAQGDRVIEEILLEARNRGIEQRISYHGYKAVGPELFSYYKFADIYVLASYSEGFPRTIWEAMAHSLPVVATEVGSIPHYLTHGKHALVVKPRSKHELANAITQVINQPDLRKRLISEAWKLVKSNTLDKATNQLVSMMCFQPDKKHNPLQSIMMIGNFFIGIGARQNSQDLAEHLSAAGWHVQTASTKVSRPLRLLDMLSTVWRRRNTYNAAIVDVFSGPSFIWAELVSVLLRMLRKPFILVLHGGNLPYFSTGKPNRVRRTLRQAELVIAPSRYLMEKMDAYRTDLQLLPYPIELKYYKYSLRSVPRPRLIWLRAFAELYNPVIAVHAVHALQDEFPTIHLLMIGPDKGDGALQTVQSVTSLLEIEANVSLSGGIAKSEVSNHLQRADIFLNTTNVDNTPISVIEAMACGLCIVSTNVGGIPYLLEHDKDALLVPPNNPQAIAEAVRRILTEPGLGEHLSRNARAKAEKFDWSVILPEWESLLTDIISRHQHE